MSPQYPGWHMNHVSGHSVLSYTLCPLLQQQHAQVSVCLLCRVDNIAKTKVSHNACCFVVLLHTPRF